MAKFITLHHDGVMSFVNVDLINVIENYAHAKDNPKYKSSTLMGSMWLTWDEPIESILNKIKFVLGREDININ